MLLAVCICAQAKNDPSQTNINRAATNTSFLFFCLFLIRLIYLFGFGLGRFYFDVVELNFTQYIYQMTCQSEGGNGKSLQISTLFLL